MISSGCVIFICVTCDYKSENRTKNNELPDIEK